MSPWAMLQRAAISQLYNTRHTLRRVRAVELVVRRTVTARRQVRGMEECDKEALRAGQRIRRPPMMCYACEPVLAAIKLKPNNGQRLAECLSLPYSTIKRALRILVVKGELKACGGAGDRQRIYYPMASGRKA